MGVMAKKQVSHGKVMEFCFQIFVGTLYTVDTGGEILHHSHYLSLP